LQVVDLGDAGDFGFVEVFWGEVRMGLEGRKGGKRGVGKREGRGGGRHTFGCVRRLVVLCEPLQVLVLHPRHPGVVLLVVVLSRLLLVRLRLCVLILVVRHVDLLYFPPGDSMK
jgi:hypothetical protein